MRHLLIEPYFSRIKPPYIPPPKKSMSHPKFWLPTIKRYEDGFQHPDMREASEACPGYLSYPDYLDIKAKADSWKAEAEATWKENHELREDIYELREDLRVNTLAAQILVALIGIIGFVIGMLSVK